MPAQIISAVTLAFICAFMGYRFAVDSMRRAFINPYPIVCEFVAKKIYLDQEKIRDWKETCLRRASLVKVDSPKKLILQDMNNVFELLNVSHLEIYDAREVRDIWHGESKSTGLEGDFVDGELVIFKVHRHSPAEAAGLKPGDVIKSLDGGQPSSWTIASESGEYLISRGQQTLKVNIHADDFQRDDSPTVTAVTNRKNEKINLLRVPSFRADFFQKENLQTLSEQLKNTKSAVIDLRGNSGGNFVAGLRFLSLFLCEPTEVGRLVRPKETSSGAAGIADLSNELSDETQLAVLQAHKSVRLKTFPWAACYRGGVRILIDGRTSSVAEMVAQAFKEFRGSVVAGAPSRGQLLVGIWYPMDEVARGVEISIPEAFYESAHGRRIEGEGVLVDRTLYYHLRQMQAGIDSWVDEMTRN